MFSPLKAATFPSTATTAKLSHAARIIRSGSKPLLSGPRASCLLVQYDGTPRQRRQFSSTARTQLREYFPPAVNAPHIKLTGPAWPHPVYNEEHMKSIRIAHREARNWSDTVALAAMRLARFGMDLATQYTHDDETKKTGAFRKWYNKRYKMTERKWLVRMVFLESVAGVPGMVAASLRHLRSLRRMERDHGWIETLLEEAYNERMHLLTFLKMAEPGLFMKTMVLGAQGVFWNMLFFSYLVSPRTVHRFVGYLEEEAVVTYTRCIADIEAGRLPKWEKLDAPDIAIRYWNMPEGHRKMKDLLLYVRADEAKHREVNHTLGNLDPKTDPNPFVSTYKNDRTPHPCKGLKNLRATGWEREDVI